MSKPVISVASIIGRAVALVAFRLVDGLAGRDSIKHFTALDRPRILWCWGTGGATSIVFTDNFSAKTIGAVLDKHMARDAHLMTDGANFYKTLGPRYASHTFVDHTRGEYVRKGDATIHTNTIEGFFGIFKRGMKGIYQHCGSQHLQRYMAEFDFRYTNRVATGCNDEQRAERSLLGIAGKRLTYRRVGSLAA